MLQAIASNGVAIVLADGDVGVSILPDGAYLVAPLDSIMAMSDWEAYEGLSPTVPPGALDEVQALMGAPA